MGDKFTGIAAKLLDTKRSLKNIKGPLLLLVHTPGDSGDYTTIATIKLGWSIETTREGLELQITESAAATPELLERLTNVCHAEKVYKVSGTDRVRPLGSPLIWRWPVKPTGESYR